MALKIKPQSTPDPKVLEPDEVIAPGEQGSEVMLAKADLAPYLKELAAMVERAKAYVVKDKQSFGQAGQMRQQVKKLKKQIVDLVGQYKRPHWDLCKEFDGIRNKHTKACDDIEAALKKKSNHYVKEEREMQRRKQEAELARQRAAAEAENRQRMKIYEAEKKAAADEAKRKQADFNKEAEAAGIEPVSVTAQEVEKLELIEVVDNVGIGVEEKVLVEGANVHVKMVPVATIETISSMEVFNYVMKFYEKDYRKLAQRAVDKAVKNGIGKIRGVIIEEQPDTSLRATK